MCKPQFSTSTKPQQVGGLLTPPLPQPVTILGCTMHKHVCKQYIFRFCNTSTFNAIRFDENPLTCQCKKRKQKGLKVSNIVLLLVIFKWPHSSGGVNRPTSFQHAVTRTLHHVEDTWDTCPMCLKMTCFAIITYESNNVGTHYVRKESERVVLIPTTESNRQESKRPRQSAALLSLSEICFPVLISAFVRNASGFCFKFARAAWMFRIICNGTKLN